MKTKTENMIAIDFRFIGFDWLDEKPFSTAGDLLIDFKNTIYLAISEKFMREIYGREFEIKRHNIPDRNNMSRYFWDTTELDTIININKLVEDCAYESSSRAIHIFNHALTEKRSFSVMWELVNTKDVRLLVTSIFTKGRGNNVTQNNAVAIEHLGHRIKNIDVKCLEIYDPKTRTFQTIANNDGITEAINELQKIFPDLKNLAFQDNRRFIEEKV